MATLSLKEQARSRAILKALGVRAKYQKEPANILAIAIWTRYIAKATGARFNNIFGLSPSSYGSQFVKPNYRLYKAKNGKYYYRFPTQAAAIKELVRIFKLNAKYPGKSNVDLAKIALNKGQGRSFLIMLAMSGLDQGNFGTDATLAQASSSMNKLLKMLVGNKWSFAQAVRHVVKQVRKRIIDMTPKYLQPPASMHPYINGYESQRFYEQRHPKVQ